MAELSALNVKSKQAKGYQPVGTYDAENDDTQSSESGPSLGKPLPPTPGLYDSGRAPIYRQSVSGLIRILVLALGLTISFAVIEAIFISKAAFRFGKAAGQAECPGDGDSPTSTVPQHFQTSPELWPGPTATGSPAFMAQTRTFNPTATYVPNTPLQTSIPIEGMKGDGEHESIFQMMGYLSPYHPSPGFGVHEYPLPAGAEIVQVQMLSRHGSRYPTTGSNVEAFAQRLRAAKSRDKRRFHGTDELSFLNDWSYNLGSEILVPRGRQELFESGILHSYMYGQLYNPHSKIIARTTTQDRMLKSAEYFMAGFFGLEWTRNATLEVVIEEGGFNNSLAGYMACPGAQGDLGGSEMQMEWAETYLADATERLGKMVGGYVWTIADSYAAQTMCPYETVAYGFSRFCSLFTYQEWRDFSYSIDLNFAGNSGFQSKTGRAVGLGYQQEVVARLRNHTLGYSGSNINTTLDGHEETFPLDQTLYFDFSHDTNIVSILTAMGLTQFEETPPMGPEAYPGKHNFTVSHITPFGARLDIEIIKAPAKVRPDRQGTGYVDGIAGKGEKRYVHFVLNQRTVPLGWSFPECDASRVDGWCDLETFLQVQDRMAALAKFDEVCFGHEGKGA